MIRRMSRQAGAFTIASFAWKHRGTVMRAVDLLRRTPELVSSGRTEDLTTEARAVAALDGPFGAAHDVRITGGDAGTVVLIASLAGPALDRTDARRVGQRCVKTVSTRWSPRH